MAPFGEEDRDSKPSEPTRTNGWPRITAKSWIWFSAISGLGLSLGLAVYAFVYAKGYSYLSDRAEACANCHVMREVLQDWRSGDHHHVALCNDCHVPAGPVSKWAVKALQGFHHSYAFTFGTPPVAIKAGHLSASIVQTNCERCHGGMVSHLIRGKTNEAYLHPSDATQPCVSCHRGVGHPH